MNMSGSFATCSGLCGRTMHGCPSFSCSNKPVAVIGGGDVACEEALFLARYASKVYIVQRFDYLEVRHCWWWGLGRWTGGSARGRRCADVGRQTERVSPSRLLPATPSVAALARANNQQPPCLSSPPHLDSRPR